MRVDLPFKEVAFLGPERLNDTRVSGKVEVRPLESLAKDSPPRSDEIYYESFFYKFYSFRH